MNLLLWTEFTFGIVYQPYSKQDALLCCKGAHLLSVNVAPHDKLSYYFELLFSRKHSLLLRN